MVEAYPGLSGNGDRSENGDYIYGKKRLREIDRRMRFLRKRLEIAEVVDPARPEDPRPGIFRRHRHVYGPARPGTHGRDRRRRRGAQRRGRSWTSAGRARTVKGAAGRHGGGAHPERPRAGRNRQHFVLGRARFSLRGAKISRSMIGHDARPDHAMATHMPLSHTIMRDGERVGVLNWGRSEDGGEGC